jgi:cysteine desulfurase/selenocysteine lyase
MSNLGDFRKDFDLLNSGDYVYFDNAATSQRPRQVLEAVSNFYKTANANPLRGLYDWSMAATDAYENSRAVVADFVGASRAKRSSLLEIRQSH